MNELKTIIQLSNFESLSILSFSLFIHFSLSYTQPLVMIIGINKQKCFFCNLFHFPFSGNFFSFIRFSFKKYFSYFFNLFITHTEYRIKSPEFSESDFRILCSIVFFIEIKKYLKRNSYFSFFVE